MNTIPYLAKIYKGALINARGDIANETAYIMFWTIYWSARMS